MESPRHELLVGILRSSVLTYSFSTESSRLNPDFQTGPMLSRGSHGPGHMGPPLEVSEANASQLRSPPFSTQEGVLESHTGPRVQGPETVLGRFVTVLGYRGSDRDGGNVSRVPPAVLGSKGDDEDAVVLVLWGRIGGSRWSFGVVWDTAS